ncbi:MAG TPA: hypothetical protein VHZ95_02230, partial [Polyangiales bacterium]|nr:hypothetical protein [Polyangiales bacterium]
MGFLCACSHPEGAPPGASPNHPDSAMPRATPKVEVKTPTESEALRSRNDLPADERALVMVNGAERWVDAKAIELAGYTIVDLRDTWTPTLFNDETTPEGVPLPNRYRRVLIGLQNDQLDADGEPLAPGEKNYLELYGAFPSWSVLRARMTQDATHECRDQDSADQLAAVETVSYVAPEEVHRDELKIARLNKEL